MKQKTFERRLLIAALGFILSFTPATSVWSQPAFPTKPINLLIGYAPGGVVDISERFMAGKAEKLLGQPIVITNNGGGGSSVAYGIVAKKAPDGYNIVGGASTGLIRIPQFRNVPYKLDEFIPIMHFATPVLTPIVVKAASPWKTFKELVDYAKKNPGKITYSTTGVGSPMHLAMEFVAKQEGITWTHVPYPGSMPSVTALLGGHVTPTSASTEWKPFVLEGRLRLLATHGEKRMKNFPNVPTLKELGYDFYNDTTFIIVAPKGTPTPMVKKLDDAFHKAWADQEYIDTLARIDHVPAFRNSEDTRKFLEVAYQINGKWIAELKIPKEQEEKK